MVEMYREPSSWKKVHIFVSSTFSDMHAERDYLVKRVFPELQDWCERRKLRLVDIDLRWGVTEQDATHNKNVIKVCLDRIDDCRPFFLCFLGQRRGWVPKANEVSDETFELFPDLRSVVGVTSVTEMEILHALINPLHRNLPRDVTKTAEHYEPSKYSFLYLRDASYLDQLPTDAPILREIYTNEWIEDEAEREEHDLALKRWREVDIPYSNRPLHPYRATWDPVSMTPELMLPLQCPSTEPANIERWRNQWQRAGITVTGLNVEDDRVETNKAKEFNRQLSTGRLSDFKCEGARLSKIIVNDLQGAIADRYPYHSEAEHESELQKEIDQQEEFLFTASEGFIEREGDFSELNDYIESDSNKLFVLTAPGGVGKSTLLANWVDRYRRRIEGRASHSIHFRFIGQSDGTTTVYSLLRMLLGEIKEVKHKLDEEIPLNPTELRNRWRAMLEAIGKRGETTIVIDALNQLESGLTDLAWLPRPLPDNIKLITSFKRGEQSAEELYERYRQDKHVTLFDVKPFADLDDRRLLVQAYLKQYLKELDEPQLATLISLRGAENPLYLKVVLSELRVFGAYANLAAQIHSDFGDTPVSAFVRVLERLENDPAYSPIDPNRAVPLLFGLLAHARRGLTVDELTNLFIQALELEEAEESREAAADTVNLFLRQVRSFLARRDGRYDFFFESFKLAAQRCYLAKADEETISKRSYQDWHRFLANYFQGLPTCRDVGDSLEAESSRQATLRKVAELPYHLIQAELWKDLEGTLCDLDFIEAKCAAEMTYDLVTDFETAEGMAPTALSEGQRWRQWKQFVNLQATNFERFLMKHPILVFQQAFNSSIGGLVAQTARGRLTEHCLPEMTWIERRNRPEHFVESACDRAYESGDLHFEALSASTAVSAMPDHSLSIWSLVSGKTIARSLPLQSPVARIRSNDSGKLVTCLEDGTISVWNPMTAEVTHTWNTGLEKPALELKEDVLLWSSTDGNDFAVTMVDLATDAPAVWFRGHHGSVRQIDLLDDQFMTTTSADRALRVWHRESGALARTIPGHGEGDTRYVIVPPRCAISYTTPAGVLSKLKHSDSTLLVWDLDTGLCINRLETGNARVQSVHSVNNGSMACVQGDRATEVWDPREGRLLYTIPVGGDSGELLALTSDTGRALFRLNENQLLLWNFGLATAERRFNARDACAPARLMDSGLLIVAAQTQAPNVWDFASGRHLGRLAGHAGRVEYLKMFDNRRLISRAADSSVRVWNVGRIRSQGSAAGREPAGTQPFLLGARQAAVLNGNVIQVWDLGSGALLHVLAGHSAAVQWVGSTPRGRIVSSAADDTMRVWDARSGRCQAVLSGHDDEITATVIMGDEKVVTGSADGTCRIWDLSEGRCLRVLGGGARVNRIEVLPGSPSSVLTAQADRHLRAWDVERGECWSDIRLGIHIDDFAILTRDKVLVAGGFMEQLGRLQVCDLKSASVVHTLREGMEQMSAMTSDGRGLVITAEAFGRIYIWHPETGTCRYSLQPPEPSFRHAFKLKVLPNQLLLAACNDAVRIWKLETGEYLGLQSDPFEVLAEACAATENGVEWLGNLYPLFGKPKVVATHNRAVLTEEQSGIVHIVHLCGPGGDSERVSDTSLIEPAGEVAEHATEKTAMSTAELATLALKTTRTLIEAGEFDRALLGLQRAEALLVDSSSWGLALRCLVESCLISRRNSRRLEPSAVERLIMSLDNPRLDSGAIDTDSRVLGSESHSPESMALKRIKELVARGAPPRLSSLFVPGQGRRTRELSYPETASYSMADSTQPSGHELADAIDQGRAILSELAAEDSEVEGVTGGDDSVAALANRAIALVGLGSLIEARPLFIEAERLARRERVDLLPILLRVHARSLLDATANAAAAIELLEEAASMIDAAVQTADWVRTTDELVRAHRLLGDQPALIACLDRRIAESRTLGLHEVMLANLSDKVELLIESHDSLPILDEIERVGLKTGELRYVYTARANRAMLRSVLLGEHGQAIAPLLGARKGLRRLGAAQTVLQCDDMLRTIRERIATNLERLVQEAATAFDNGNAEIALEKIGERIEQCREASDQEELAKGLVEQAYVLQQIGRSAEATPALTEARRIAKDGDLQEITERIAALGG